MDQKEINLIDYIKIILKRKNLVVVLTVLFAIIGFVTSSSSSPKVYTAETTVSIGKQPFNFLEEPVSLAEKIKNGLYGKYSGLEALVISNTDLVKISLESTDPEAAKKALAEVGKSIIEDHNNKLNLEKEAFIKKIDGLKESIDFLMPRGQQIAALQVELLSLQDQAENFSPTRVISEPTIVSSTSPKPNFGLITGALLGFFLSIFLAFCLEWWQKNKNELKQ